MGQFKHVIRRNVPFVYIIENNGVYGLTKGQFSATADEGQFLKYYGTNHMPPIDLALEAVIAGCTFVARSFSGDAKQVQTLLQAAVRHPGAAVLDIISPCVTFNNAETSTKSYPYGRDHEIPLHEIQLLAPDYVHAQEEITIDDYDEGEIIDVEMHDGSFIRLKKLDNRPRSAQPAQGDGTCSNAIHARADLLHRLIYYEEPRPTLADTEDLVATPLAHLDEPQLRPSKEALDNLMQSLMAG